MGRVAGPDYVNLLIARVIARHPTNRSERSLTPKAS